MQARRHGKMRPMPATPYTDAASTASTANADAAPTIIAIETSTELASVALLHRGQLRSLESVGAQTHSTTVPVMLQQLLAEAGLKLGQCDALAFGMGPGSFTGVRTACGLAQGLAFGAGLGIAPVVTLMAMAEAVRESGASDEVLAVLDARMGEVYWAQYRFERIEGSANGGRWHCVSAPRLSLSTEVHAQGRPVVCGNGLLACPDGFPNLSGLQQAPAVMPHASAVARLATGLLQSGELVAPRDAQPLYLRNKVALTTAERAIAYGRPAAKTEAAV